MTSYITSNPHTAIARMYLKHLITPGAVQADWTETQKPWTKLAIEVGLSTFNRQNLIMTRKLYNCE